MVERVPHARAKTLHSGRQQYAKSPAGAIRTVLTRIVRRALSVHVCYTLFLNAHRALWRKLWYKDPTRHYANAFTRDKYIFNPVRRLHKSCAKISDAIDHLALSPAGTAGVMCNGPSSNTNDTRLSYWQFYCLSPTLRHRPQRAARSCVNNNPRNCHTPFARLHVFACDERTLNHRTALTLIEQ